MTDIAELLLNLLNCSTEQAWCDTFFALGNNLGFNLALFGLLPNKQTPVEKLFGKAPGDTSALPAAFLRSSYSPQWRDAYDSHDFHAVDPTVSHCLTMNLPLLWTPGIFKNTRQKELYEEARGYGLHSGISLPIHGANGVLGGVSFVSDTPPDSKFLRDAGHAMPKLALIRDYALESSLRFANFAKTSQVKINITPREMECLKWTMSGKSSWEIGGILCCSEAAVNFHFANIRRKFDVNNRQQAVVKAIGLGLIAAP